MPKAKKHSMMRMVTRIAANKNAVWYIAALALASSMLFCFLVYPMISGSHDLELDPDSHGNLAYGMWHLHTFSYYPDTQPTIERGPLYPAFILMTLVLSHDWWPYSVQLGQCLLFALMCGLVFWISSELWSRRVGVITATLCALHPLTVWYTSRIWVETMSMLLFTAALAGMVYTAKRPSVGRGVLLGIILAAAALTKGTFLPYAILVPLCLWFVLSRDTRMKVCVTVLLSALVLIAPWTVRNYRLTGKFIPIHARMGFNVEIGDELVMNWSKAPLSLMAIWEPSVRTYKDVWSRIPKDLPKYKKELILDDEMMKISMERYRRHPAFVLKKMAVNALMFWTLGATPDKSIVISILLLTLLALMVVSFVITRRRRELLPIMSAQLLMIFVYYAMHIPVEAIARYSVVLLPAMIMYGIGPILQSLIEDKT